MRHSDVDFVQIAELAASSTTRVWCVCITGASHVVVGCSDGSILFDLENRRFCLKTARTPTLLAVSLASNHFVAVDGQEKV